MILVVDLIIILISKKKYHSIRLYQYLKTSQQYINIILNKNKNKNNLMYIY
jgi:hypothetical protein